MHTGDSISSGDCAQGCASGGGRALACGLSLAEASDHGGPSEVADRHSGVRAGPRERSKRERGGEVDTGLLAVVTNTHSFTNSIAISLAN